MSAAEGLSTRGGFAGPDELQALEQFVRLTGSASESIKLNAAATNLARGTSLGYTQTQRMIGQVLTGNTGRLQRYLGIIQPVKNAEFALSQAHKVNVMQLEAQSKALGTAGPLWLKQQEILHGLTPQELQHAQLLDRQATAMMVLQRIQQRYGGATAAFSHTTGGAISNLRNQFDILAKTIGQKLLPVLNTLLQFISKHTTLVMILAGVLTGLAVIYGTVTAAAAAWEAITTAGTVAMGVASVAAGVWSAAVFVLSGAFEAMGVAAGVAWTIATGGLILIVAAVAAAIYLIVTHLKTIVNAFKTAFTAIVNLPVIKQVIGIIGDIANFLGGGGGARVSRASAYGIHGQIGRGGRPVGMLGHAQGGFIGGYGGGDIVPAMLEPGEFVLQRSTVQNIGVQRLNSINASGTIAGSGGGGSDTLHVTMPVQLRIGNQRILAEQVVKFAAVKNALSGAYVSG